MATQDGAAQDSQGNGQDTGDQNQGAGGRDINLNLNVSGKGDQGGDGDDLASKDTSKFDDAQKNDYIEKLKDENARRRITNKKLSKQIEDMSNQFNGLKEQLDSLTEEKKTREQKDKEAELAEKSEIEQLKTRLTDLEKGIGEKESELTNLRTEMSKKDAEIAKRTRENMVDRLVRSQGVQFASDYEREGFIGDLLKTDAKGEFSLNDDEVIYQVTQFTKKRGATATPETPGAGPQGKMTTTPLAQEVQQLLAKENLNADEQKRLDEILVEIEQQQTGGGQ